MKEDKNLWQGDNFRRRLDDELKEVSLSYELQNEIVDKIARKKSLLDRFLELLNTTILIPIPQLAFAFMVVLMLGGLYWNNLIGIDVTDLKRYEKEDYNMEFYSPTANPSAYLDGGF